MRIRHHDGTDCIFRMAALTYMAPRVVIGFLVAAMLALGAFLILLQMVLIVLRQLAPET
jgi:hypothetical protein